MGDHCSVETPRASVLAVCCSALGSWIRGNSGMKLCIIYGGSGGGGGGLRVIVRVNCCAVTPPLDSQSCWKSSDTQDYSIPPLYLADCNGPSLVKFSLPWSAPRVRVLPLQPALSCPCGQKHMTGNITLKLI